MLASVFFENIKIPDKAVVASYCAFRNEIDPSIIAARLREKGYRIALPAIDFKLRKMEFRLYDLQDELIKNKMGILEPSKDATAAVPDVLLVPVVAFDKKLQRIGYGGGFYDRHIKMLRNENNVLAIGIAHSCQEVEHIPSEPHDEAMDCIVTEINCIGRI